MTLFPYQEKAVEFMVNAKRAYLALDMGMGKTLTSIAAAAQASQGNILLVAEKNEIVNSQNFKKEIETHFDGELTYISLRKASLDELEPGKRYVCGINPNGLYKLDIRELQALFSTLVMDEATLAKNTTTDRFTWISSIARTMEHVYLLSGTPMMNGAAELYAPLTLLQHPLVHNKGTSGKMAFEVIFAGGHSKKVRNTGNDYKDYMWWAKGANHVRELRWLIRDRFFFMKKGETDVFKKRNRKVEYVQMTLPWLSEYTQAWDNYFLEQEKTRNRYQLQNIAELRNVIENGKVYQVNSKWKAAQVAADVAAGKYGDRRIVIFCLYIDTETILQEELTKHGVSFKTFEDIQEYKAGSEQVLVGRIRAHGKGGNLPEASVALFVDMDYVPANNIQAENRIDRPEQKNEMDVIYYITRGAEIIDEHVRSINRDKARAIEEFTRPFTEEEIAEMPYRLSELRAKYGRHADILGI